ncbi:MAG: hypothetical protein WC563_15290 [Brevundimonas sp.]
MTRSRIAFFVNIAATTAAMCVAWNYLLDRCAVVVVLLVTIANVASYAEGRLKGERE